MSHVAANHRGAAFCRAARRAWLMIWRLRFSARLCSAVCSARTLADCFLRFWAPLSCFRSRVLSEICFCTFFRCSISSARSAFSAALAFLERRGSLSGPPGKTRCDEHGHGGAEETAVGPSPGDGLRPRRGGRRVRDGRASGSTCTHQASMQSDMKARVQMIM